MYETKRKSEHNEPQYLECVFTNVVLEILSQMLSLNDLLVFRRTCKTINNIVRTFKLVEHVDTYKMILFPFSESWSVPWQVPQPYNESIQVPFCRTCCLRDMRGYNGYLDNGLNTLHLHLYDQGCTCDLGKVSCEERYRKYSANLCAKISSSSCKLFKADPAYMEYQKLITIEDRMKCIDGISNYNHEPCKKEGNYDHHPQY